MTDFLLELLSEEIPARMQAKARADLERLFAEEIAKSGLKAGAIETHATPRRLVLIARGLPAETAAISEELKGPRAFAPPQALEGFLRKTGLTAEQLVDRDGVLYAVIDKPGRATPEVLAEAIPTIVRAFPWPKSMRWGTASSSTASLRWVRPLQGIVALFGDDVVDFEIDGLRSGAATVGHRFHHPGPITIGSAHDYVEKLRACHVIVSHEERQQIIRDGAAKAASAGGLSVIPDEGLVQENAGLTEYPVPLLGKFDPAFLEVPREVIQLTMRTNQKYFALTDGEGKLAPNFICTANIEPTDGGTAIAAGNAKVLAARLSDAKFFWEQDLKIPLEEQAKKLDQIVFHEKLGTVADKVDRVAKLARWLVEEGIVIKKPLPFKRGVGVGESAQAPASDGDTHPPTPSLEREGALADLAEQAARLCKADLVTGMVGEFPELQGVMGGYYARAQGLAEEVADAIRDHYKPVGQGDDVPTAPVTVAVSLADKLDTLAGFFSMGEPPTGSKDPFALRRAAIAVIRLLTANNVRLGLRNVDLLLVNNLLEHFVIDTEIAVRRSVFDWISDVAEIKPRTGSSDFALAEIRGEVEAPLDPGFMYDLLDFFADRLKVQQREAGVRHDLIDAVFALGGEDDLVRLLARVKALQSFVATDDGANLLTGYKRAANILRKEGWSETASARHPGHVPGSTRQRELAQEGEWMPEQVRHDDLKKTLSYKPLDEEAALIAALDAAEQKAGAAVDAEDFEGAMAALAGLRAPIDAFFDKVTVNDPDPAKREARLGLLARIRDAVHTVADFSRIEG
jgi:glycyl-tRNA synthetase beta chain